MTKRIDTDLLDLDTDGLEVVAGADENDRVHPLRLDSVTGGLTTTVIPTGGSLHARDANNEQVTPLLASATFEGEYTRVDTHGHFEILYAATTPLTSVQKIWSDDGVNPLGGAFGTSTLVAQEVNGYFVYYDVNEGRNIAPYYKLKVVNGASDQTAFPGFICLVWLIDGAYQGAFGLLDAQLNNLSRALLTRAVQAGVQPDGDFVNVRADGLAFVTEEALAGGVTYDSRDDNGYIDTDGWQTISVVVTSDQVSGSNGLVIHYMDDIQAVTPMEIDFAEATFSAASATKGSETFTFDVVGDGFYLTYQNGGTPADPFRLQVDLRIASIIPRRQLKSAINSNSQALTTRSVLFAENDAGDWGLITRSNLGGKRVSIKEHEANTPLKPDTGFSGSTANVTATPSKIVDITALPAGCTGFQVQGASGNNQKCFFSNASGTASNASGMFELDAGQAQYIGVGEDATTDLWCASASGTQLVRIMYIFGGGV